MVSRLAYSKKGRERCVADLVIGFRGIRERFSSRVIGDWERCALMSPTKMAPFAIWKIAGFLPRLTTINVVDFYVDFEFRSALLQKMIGLIFLKKRCVLWLLLLLSGLMLFITQSVMWRVIP